MIFDMPTCGGCRTCEIACSYHHLRAFAPSVSSIKIFNKPDGVGYRVRLLVEDGELGRGCDGCAGLEVPYCVGACKDAEELMAMLQQLPARIKSEAGSGDTGR